RRSRVHRRGPFRLDTGGGAAHLVGYLLDLGSARGSSGHVARYHRRRAIRVWHGTAAAPTGEQRREARSPGYVTRYTGSKRIEARTGVGELTVRPSDG